MNIRKQMGKKARLEKIPRRDRPKLLRSMRADAARAGRRAKKQARNKRASLAKLEKA